MIADANAPHSVNPFFSVRKRMLGINTEPGFVAKIWRIRIGIFYCGRRLRKERRGRESLRGHRYTRRRNIYVWKGDVSGVYYSVSSGRVRSG